MNITWLTPFEIRQAMEDALSDTTKTSLLPEEIRNKIIINSNTLALIDFFAYWIEKKYLEKLYAGGTMNNDVKICIKCKHVWIPIKQDGNRCRHPKVIINYPEVLSGDKLGVSCEIERNSPSKPCGRYGILYEEK